MRKVKKYIFVVDFKRFPLMSSKPNVIEHLGRVEAITPTDIRVVILSQSACASCHAKGACSAADMSEKQVVVSKSFHSYTVGETVKVSMKQSQGFKALWLGYLLPMVLIIVFLFLFTAIGFSEAKAGIFSLLVLVPYYLVLYLFKGKFEKEFNFEIEKI